MSVRWDKISKPSFIKRRSQEEADVPKEVVEQELETSRSWSYQELNIAERSNPRKLKILQQKLRAFFRWTQQHLKSLKSKPKDGLN